MNIARWDPFRELEDVTERLNRMFARSALARPTGETGKDTLTIFDWAPRVDIAETAEEYQIKAELPEVKPEEVKVTVENGVLRIEGERKQEKEEKGKRFHRIERSYGSFCRTFTLPDDVDENDVRAKLEGGMLNVRLTKAQKAKAKAIEVKLA